MNEGLQILLWLGFLIFAIQVWVGYTAIFIETLNPLALIASVGIIAMLSYHKYAY